MRTRSKRCKHCGHTEIRVKCDGCGKDMGTEQQARSFFLGVWESMKTLRQRARKPKLRPFSNNEPLVACSMECLVKVLQKAAKKAVKGGEYGIGINLRTKDAPEVLESFARQLRSIRD